MQIHNAVITGSFSYNGADLSNVTSSNAYSASLSTRVTQIENVYATTGSNSFRATQSITGSLTVTGQIVAQTLNVQQVTSSIVYSSGSNTFGCDLNSRQTFTGSVYITGSNIIANVNTTCFSGNVCASAASFKGDGIYNSLYVDNSSSSGGGGYIVRQNGVDAGGIGVSAWWKGGTTCDVAISAYASRGIRFFTNGSDVERVTIDSNGISCFACQVCMPATAIISGGGNTLTLKKGTGSSALAFGGTSDQASILIEGISGGGMTWYTAPGCTLSNANWTSRFSMDANGVSTFACKVCANTLTLGLSANNIFTRSNGVDYSRFLYSGGCGNVMFTGATTAQSGLIGVNNYEDTVRLFNLYNNGTACFFVNTVVPACGVKFGNGSTVLNYYEEGTFNPTVSSTSFNSVTPIYGRYVRIGNQITINNRWNVDANTTGKKYLVFDLPFAFYNNGNINYTGAVSNYNQGDSSYSSNVGTTVRNSGGSLVQQYVEAVYTSTASGGFLLLSMTYQTF